MARLPAERGGDFVRVKQRPLPFSYWPMYKGARRYGLQSNVFSTNPWALIRTAVKTGCVSSARPEALASVDQAQQFFAAGVDAELVAAKPLLLYYAFLNLAKALALARQRRPTFDRAQHGLSEKLTPNGKELVDAYLEAHASRAGRTPNLFDEFLGAVATATVVNRYDLPILLPQILAGHRLWCDATGKHERFISLESINIMEDAHAKEIWIRLHIYADDLTRLGITRKRLLEEARLLGSWREVESVEQNDRKLLRFEQLTATRYSHRASDEIPDLVATVRPLVWATVNSAPPFRRYYLYLAPSSEHPQVLPQLGSIYAIMFFLGSIARYRPQQMAAVLEGLYGEHIQELIASQPNQFLYLIASEFTRRDVTRAAIV